MTIKSRPERQSTKDALEAGDIETVINTLSDMQKAFAEEYVTDFNGAGAAIRAGYSKNYPDRQAHVLLQHDGVAAYIDYLIKRNAAKIMSVDPDYVLREITRIVSKNDAKDSDKLRGLELLARHLGMFIERTEISGPDGGAIKHEEIQNEADAFQRRIASIAKRNRADGDSLKSVGGSEG